MRALAALALLISVSAAARNLLVSKPRVADELSITTEVINPALDTSRTKRAECANGTNDDPAVRCVPGLDDVAFFYAGSLHIYKQNSTISLHLRNFPENAAVHDADKIALGRLALRKL